MPDVVVFAALAWEAQLVGALLAAPNAVAANAVEGRLPDGATCLLVQTGLGLDRALAAAHAVPAARGFVTIGCAGGLAAHLRAGDLVAASAVGLLDPDGRAQAHWPAAECGLTAYAARHGIAIEAGPIVSSPVPLATREQKRRAAESGALAVDMESAAVVGVALRRDTPFAALRVVLDAADDAVPADLDAVDALGRVRPLRAARAFVRHPRALARLARQRAVAVRRLRTALPIVLRAEALGFPPASAALRA